MMQKTQKVLLIFSRSLLIELLISMNQIHYVDFSITSENSKKN